MAALATKQVRRANTPQIAGYSQKNILLTFLDTLLGITGILFNLAELCADKAQSPSTLSRR